MREALCTLLRSAAFREHDHPQAPACALWLERRSDTNAERSAVNEPDARVRKKGLEAELD